MKPLCKFALALAFVLAAATGAPAQFSPPPEQGGPVAVGQAMAQVDPSSNRVAIVQAPAPPAEARSGGVIQLSAFGWLQPYVDTIAQALIAAGFAWFAKSKYGQMMDDASRGALETFLKNRASSLIADGAVRVSGKAVHVDSGLLYRAASESATAIPDALKRFKLSPEVVAQKIIDAIPQTTAGAAIIADAHRGAGASSDPEPVPITDRPAAAPGFVPPVSAA